MKFKFAWVKVIRKDNYLIHSDDYGSKVPEKIHPTNLTSLKSDEVPGKQMKYPVEQMKYPVEQTK